MTHRADAAFHLESVYSKEYKELKENITSSSMNQKAFLLFVCLLRDEKQVNTINLFCSSKVRKRVN